MTLLTSRSRGWLVRAVTAVAVLPLPGLSSAACTEQPLPGESLRLVSEQMWVHGMSLSIAEVPALEAGVARERFGDFWRKDHRDVRTASKDGVEVSSVMKDGCLYSLQLPADAANGLPVRLVVTDLRRSPPKLRRSFDWAPAADADLITDTVSEDGKRLNRLLSYRVDQRAGTAAGQCIERLVRADWTIAGVTIMNDRQVTFSGRKGTTILDAVISKDGTGAVVTMNFTERDG